MSHPTVERPMGARETPPISLFVGSGVVAYTDESASKSYQSGEQNGHPPKRIQTMADDDDKSHAKYVVLSTRFVACLLFEMSDAIFGRR
jgi:hypothetical protein